MRAVITGRVFFGGKGISRTINHSNSFTPFFTVERLRTDRTVRLEMKFSYKLSTSLRAATRRTRHKDAGSKLCYWKWGDRWDTCFRLEKFRVIEKKAYSCKA
jgi:hypothetical protein